MGVTTIIPRLRSDVVEAVKKSLSAKNRLQFELKKSYVTIQRWLETNDSKLTMAHALNIISEETGIALEDLLEK
jgi:hypothetical protein